MHMSAKDQVLWGEIVLLLYAAAAVAVVVIISIIIITISIKYRACFSSRIKELVQDKRYWT